VPPNAPPPPSPPSPPTQPPVPSWAPPPLPPLSPDFSLWAYVTFSVRELSGRRLSAGRRLALDALLVEEATRALLPNATNVLVNLTSDASGEVAYVRVVIDRRETDLTSTEATTAIASAAFADGLALLLGTALALGCCTTAAAVLPAPTPPPAPLELEVPSFGQDALAGTADELPVILGIVAGIVLAIALAWLLCCHFCRRRRRRALAAAPPASPSAEGGQGKLSFRCMPTFMSRSGAESPRVAPGAAPQSAEVSASSVWCGMTPDRPPPAWQPPQRSQARRLAPMAAPPSRPFLPPPAPMPLGLTQPRSTYYAAQPPLQTSASFDATTCAGHEREHVRIDAWVLPSQPWVQMRSSTRLGQGSAQLSTPYPCRAALLQHPRPPLQGAAAGSHLVVLWSEQS